MDRAYSTCAKIWRIAAKTRQKVSRNGDRHGGAWGIERCDAHNDAIGDVYISDIRNDLSSPPGWSITLHYSSDPDWSETKPYFY